MAARNILHVDEVEPRVEIGRHPAVQKIDDDSPGRSWLVVELANRRRRIGNHERNAVAGGFKRGLFGKVLRALVGPDHVSLGHWSIFATWPIQGNAERANGAGMDDAPHAASAS